MFEQSILSNVLGSFEENTAKLIPVTMAMGCFFYQKRTNFMSVRCSIQKLNARELTANVNYVADYIDKQTVWRHFHNKLSLSFRRRLANMYSNVAILSFYLTSL